MGLLDGLRYPVLRDPGRFSWDDVAGSRSAGRQGAMPYDSERRRHREGGWLCSRFRST
ncbi:hypothetical protein HMPREF1129_2410 [Actinomyces naeslundii str. Howell 279]|uniref:Uncharacterized protein n=1 Tax=Actinomyces naeslundii (strain ATCC 12104 / DSM 43013 / CCUG 2238 / JCM 8349 / NCTC 10301 / Howell 279) TaxID=1115803 RepID=J3JLI6_ACTNH|nr:hypothetical protein HMPREF1129_2410 [Actinomyces naeslundii str. Howell 279]